MSEVSPRPWKLDKRFVCIADANGQWIEDVEAGLRMAETDAEHIVKCVNEAEAKDKKIAALEESCQSLRAELDAVITERSDLRHFADMVRPFLLRLKEPRYDANETNDYICGSTDCQAALNALALLVQEKTNDYEARRAEIDAAVGRADRAW